MLGFSQALKKRYVKMYCDIAAELAAASCVLDPVDDAEVLRGLEGQVWE